MRYDVLNLRFEVPEVFVDRTERYSFADDAEEPSQWIRIVREGVPTAEAVAASFLSLLNDAYDRVSVLRSDEEADLVRIAAEVWLSGDAAGHVELAAFKHQLAFSLQSERVDGAASNEWRAAVGSFRIEGSDHYGWRDDEARRYQVDGMSIDVPRDWLDLTSYTLGTSTSAQFDIQMKAEEEPETPPHNRVQGLLLRLEAADPSYRLLAEESIEVDGHDAYRATWTAVERGETMLHDFVAISTGERKGAHLFASGSDSDFADYNDDWAALFGSITVR